MVGEDTDFFCGGQSESPVVHGEVGVGCDDGPDLAHGADTLGAVRADAVGLIVKN